MPDPSPSNAGIHKLQLLTARKKEWWPATVDHLPQAIHSTLAGIEPTSFRLLLLRAASLPRPPISILVYFMAVFFVKFLRLCLYIERFL